MEFGIGVCRERAPLHPNFRGRLIQVVPLTLGLNNWVIWNRYFLCKQDQIFKIKNIFYFFLWVIVLHFPQNDRKRTLQKKGIGLKAFIKFWYLWNNAAYATFKGAENERSFSTDGENSGKVDVWFRFCLQQVSGFQRKRDFCMWVGEWERERESLHYVWLGVFSPPPCVNLSSTRDSQSDQKKAKRA